MYSLLSFWHMLLSHLVWEPGSFTLASLLKKKKKEHRQTLLKTRARAKIKSMHVINKKFLPVCLLATFVLLASPVVLSQTNNPAWSDGSGSKGTSWAGQETHVDTIRSWFMQYDQIRRTAQMSPAERQQADQVLSRGLALFMPGQDKTLGQSLLTDLVRRYQIACQQLSTLQLIPATEQLHRGYYQYFCDARRLFSDYLKLQEDLLAVDPATGQPLASGLIERKQNLELLDQNNKALDQQLRTQYGIPPYRY